MLKLLILTTDKSLLKWKSLPKKLATIEKTLNSGKNADFTVEFKYTDVTPKVVNGRIDHKWLEDNNRPYFSQGNDLIGLHMSRKQWRELGLQESLRGANPKDKSEQEDFYFSADENNKRKGEDRFVQVCLHEAAHGYYQETGENDLTHQWHDRNPDISGLFKTFDWSKYQPKRQALKATLRATLFRMVELLQDKLKTLTVANIKPQTPILPVPFLRITQDYGVYNPKLYPSTNYHWGLDLRAAKGTPVKAPLDGEVIESNYSKSLGYWLQFFDGKHYHIIPHLAAKTKLGKYKQGDVIGNISDTGLITAVHCHLEIWTVRMVDRINQLKESGWDVTVDPAKYYNLKN